MLQDLRQEQFDPVFLGSMKDGFRGTTFNDIPSSKKTLGLRRLCQHLSANWRIPMVTPANSQAESANR